MNVIKNERTGKAYSFSSSEFLVTYIDGSTITIWSPPWHDMDDEEEELAGKEYAERDFLLRNQS